MNDEDPKKDWRQALHVYHVWINRRQEERRKSDPSAKHESSLYEFKSMLDFLEYGHTQIQQAYEGKLRVLHQQCSFSAPEEITGNTLKCAIGTDVTACPILLSLKQTYTEERERECGILGKHYAGMTDEHLYRLMARTCAWHMYSEQFERGRFLDTSEGFLMDESDRRYWSRVYESMAAPCPDAGDAA